VLTAVALLLLVLGMSRVLTAGVGEETVSAEGLGMALVAFGSVLLALVAVLAVRTSAVPFAGGLLALVVGSAYLFSPAGALRQTVRLLATTSNRDAVLNASGIAVLGVVFTVGLVLLGSATGASLVRRRGIEVGSFRERSRSPGSR
jgi:hypothetical protein